MPGANKPAPSPEFPFVADEGPVQSVPDLKGLELEGLKRKEQLERNIKANEAVARLAQMGEWTAATQQIAATKDRLVHALIFEADEREKLALQVQIRAYQFVLDMPAKALEAIEHAQKELAKPVF